MLYEVITVQLLRLGEGLDTRRALLAESLAYASLQAGAEFDPDALGSAGDRVV